MKIESRDPNGLWCIEMADVPDLKSAFDEMEDEGNRDENSATSDFYLTADFDQNLTMLQKFTNFNTNKADLLQIRASAFIGQQITSIWQAKPRGQRMINCIGMQQTHPTDVFISPSYL